MVGNRPVGGCRLAPHVGRFKRSSRFGLIGVFVVAAIVLLIATTTTGQGEANPKTTLALVFGVIAVFCAILFALQRSDLNRVSSADARAAPAPASEGGRQVENPMTMDGRLWGSR
jgi:hypothetical protein